MATTDNDIEKTLSQLIEKLLQTDQFLHQLDQECHTEGSEAFQKEEAMEELNGSRIEMRETFYDLLEPFFESNDVDIYNLGLSEIQDELFRVIGTKGKDELVRLTESLEGLKKSIDEINQRVLELMLDLNIEPIFCEDKDMYDRERPFDLTDLAQEVAEEKNEGVEVKESTGVLSVSDVAIQMYGFATDIAEDIKESLWSRKLIKNEKRFDREEAAIKFDDEDSHEDELQEKDPVLLSWVSVKKLKQKFEELKKKIYKKQEPADVNVETKMLAGGGDEDPLSLMGTFLRVLRHWIFHIESVLFNFVMYELYYLLPGIETAEATFEDFKATLKNLMEISHGMAPIVVYKIIYMMENPKGIGLDENGVMIRAPSVCGSDRRTLYEKIELNEVMEHVHKIILRLSSVLVTSGLSYTHFLREDESVIYEKMLNNAEDEVREIQLMINWAKSKFIRNILAD